MSWLINGKYSLVAAFCFLFVMSKAVSQGNKTVYFNLKRNADAHFVDEIFKTALPLYLKLDAIDPGNAETSYKIGVCYLHSSNKAKSIPYFEQARKKQKSDQHSDIDYYLGVAYHHDHQFDKAIEFYNRYKKGIDSISDYGSQVLPTINKYIQNCHVGKLLVGNPTQAKVQHLNTNINTIFAETYPVVSWDLNNLYFSSQRKESTGGKIDLDTEEFYEDIYVSKNVNQNWGPVTHLRQVNSMQHDAPLSISADGKKLFFYSTDKNNLTDIFYTEYAESGWSQPINMGPSINSASGEFGASISADGKLFYFASDRPGGYGGMDIYMATQMADGSWGNAVNLGPIINTMFDEESPEILADNTTLYFSSDSPNSIGGLDIFRSTRTASDSSWSQPVNMGYPLNTAEHEYHVSWSPDGKSGYFAASRKDSYGEEDIYFVELGDTEVDTKVYAREGSGREGEAASPYGANITDNSLDNKNKIFGKPEKGSVLKQKAFFDFNIASEPASFSSQQLQEVVNILNQYPDLMIEIQGYSDSIGTLAINKSISEKRAHALYRYLVGRGLDGKRFKIRGYNFQNLVVRGNSQLENAPNRRVEFKVISQAEMAEPAVADAPASTPKQWSKKSIVRTGSSVRSTSKRTKTKSATSARK